MFERNKVLGDLRHNVIEVILADRNTNTQNTYRITLKLEHMPESYKFNIDEQRQEQSYHNSNPDQIAAWNVRGGGWIGFHIDNLIYCQSMDGY